MNETSATIDFAKIDKPYLVRERNVILLPDRPEYHPILPKGAQLRLMKNIPFYVVKNSPRINSMLSMLGHRVLSPIYFDRTYPWGHTKPFAAQVEMAALCVSRRRLYNLSQMGVGKTRGTLYAIDWMIRNNYMAKALVVAPLSILHNVWQNEIYKNFPRLKPMVIYGTREKRLKCLATHGANIHIINHDGIKVLPDELVKQNYDMIVLDELSVYRDPRTERWKATAALVKKIMYAIGLTGSPTPNGPWDAYGLAKMIRPDTTPMTFVQFKQSVAIEVRQHIWVPRKNASDTVFRLLQPAVRFTRAQVYELRERFTHPYKVNLSKYQIDLLRELADHAIALYKEGKVDAVNAAVMVSKVLQASAGAVYAVNDAKERKIIDLKAEPRLEMAEELYREADAKVIIFVAFKHLVHIVKAHFDAKKIENDIIYGAVTQKDRNKIITNFQDPRSSMRLLIAHPKTMSHGLTLTVANTVIWYGPTTSNDTYTQANDRITRAGQTREQLIYHLYSTSAEEKIFNGLKNNGNMQELILKLFVTGDLT